MKVTITDIARDTGLSLATISKYLNNKNVLPENQARIEASIRKLGYTPNRIAQSLRSRETRTIALLIPSLDSYFWGTMITCIESILRENGYKSIIYAFPPDKAQQAQIVSLVLSNHVDGIIAIASYTAGEAFSTLCASSIPVILMDQIVESFRTDYVTSDNYHGGYLAGKYLAEHRHRRIAFVSGFSYAHTIKMRTKGFLDALRDAGIPPAPQYYSYQTPECPSAKEQVEKLLRLKNPPTALFFCSYDLCLSGVPTLLDAGFRIPEDLSVVSFDDDILFSSLHPRITVINQNLEEIGKQAAHLLLTRLSGDQTNFPEKVFVPVSLIERASVREI